MTRKLDRQAVDLLRAAVVAGDKTVDVYLDRERLVIVKVKDGLCKPDDLDAKQVEEDEARFAEIPVITRIGEYLWMQDFVEERDEKRVTALLDSRAGANERFLKQLTTQAPDALPDWEAYRETRIDEMAAEWFEGLGVATEDTAAS